MEIGFYLPMHIAEKYGIKKTRWVVVRNTYPELRDTTMRTIFDWFPGGTYRNKEFRSKMVDSADIADVMLDILFDPQTSGGLFVSVSADKASLLLARLKEAGVIDAAIVGEVVSHPKQRIVVE